MATPHLLALHRNKRHKPLLQTSFYNDRVPSTTALISEDNAPDQQDFWTNSALFAIDIVQQPGQHPVSTNPRKRNISSLSLERIDGPIIQNANISTQNETSSGDWLAAQFPELEASVPNIENRIVNLHLENPFLEDSAVRHPVLTTHHTLPEDGAVNGYIKFRIRFSTEDDTSDRPQIQKTTAFNQSTAAVHHRSYHAMMKDHVPCVPPDFGKGCKLDAMDRKLMTFYVSAFCSGRTLLPKTNFWLCQIAPIADKNEAVSHAVLALSAGYVLDYKPVPAIQARANYHYKKAVELLDRALRDPNCHEVGKDDAIIAALIMLLSNDIVNWELRKPKAQEQRWYAGAKVAVSILDNSDPGYRYYHPNNVQASNARVYNATLIASLDITAKVFLRLKFAPTDSTYGWLLEGTKEEVLSIHGVLGLCPKLLHTYAQITHFCARLEQSPTSTIFQIGAKRLEQRVANFHQWSDLSDGYGTAEDLLASCELDENGQVNCPAKITDLTGETWVAAAQIYLQCRFFRRPRSHPDVKKPLYNLLRCVERMPCSGTLFTQQSPLFPVFVMGVVSYLEEDRNVVRNWFDAVLLGAGCRSSVPPVWENLKDLWKWMDNELEEDDPDFDAPIDNRTPWWEQMISKLITIAGQLNLT